MRKPNPHPHVKWRDGRPRFEPGRVLRDAGYKATDLRWPAEPAQGWKAAGLKPGEKNAGRWFSKGEAVDWSIAFVKSLAKKRGRKPAARRQEKFYTLARLMEDWFASRKFILPGDPAELNALLRRQRHMRQKLVYAPKTASDYRNKAHVIESHDPSLWASPVDALTQPVMFGLYEELVETRGVATARGVLTVLSIALGWGRKRGKFTFRMNQGVNPARNLDMATSPPRIRFGTRLEVTTLIRAADAIGRREVGDMIMLGLWTGQRQGDRLAMVDKGLLNGRRIFRQAKTGAVVAIREVPELSARLAAAQERRRAARAAELLAAATPEARQAVEQRFAHVILDEAWDTRPLPHVQRWQPFKSSHYSHVFAEVRAAAVAGVPDGAGGWKVQACASLADFLEMDLRDTAVTWMALAGATIPEIISVTGHSLQSATDILKHYLARHPEMADEALRKMVAWYEADGETEIGL